MSELVLRWRAGENAVLTRWLGPEGVMSSVARGQSIPLAGLVVPAAVLQVTGGDGVDLIGNEIRINIEELPRA